MYYNKWKMARAILPHALIFVLLMCPYLCLGKDVAHVSHSTALICSCCKTADPTDSQSPRPRDDNTSDCLCHGAIFGGSRGECWESDIGENSAPVWGWNEGNHLPSLPFVQDSLQPHHFPQHFIRREAWRFTPGGCSSRLSVMSHVTMREQDGSVCPSCIWCDEATSISSTSTTQVVGK